MKTKDLVVGQKYAVKDCGTNCATYLSAGWSEGGVSFRPNYRQDGGPLLLVEFEPGLFGSKEKTRRYVRPQAILDLWEQYEAARTAKNAKSKAIYESQKLASQQNEARLRNAAAMLVLEGIECSVALDWSQKLCIVFTAEQAESLVEVLTAPPTEPPPNDKPSWMP